MLSSGFRFTVFFFQIFRSLTVICACISLSSSFTHTYAFHHDPLKRSHVHMRYPFPFADPFTSYLIYFFFKSVIIYIVSYCFRYKIWGYEFLTVGLLLLVKAKDRQSNTFSGSVLVYFLAFDVEIEIEFAVLRS